VKLPPPATVVILPVERSSFRILALLVSAMSRFPLLSMATPEGWLSEASFAAPSSPPEPAIPLPATVVMMCVTWSTLRMRWLNVSAMKRFPLASIATAYGALSVAALASPSSPRSPVPPPATVVMIPVDRLT